MGRAGSASTNALFPNRNCGWPLAPYCIRNAGADLDEGAGAVGGASPPWPMPPHVLPLPLACLQMMHMQLERCWRPLDLGSRPPSSSPLSPPSSSPPSLSPSSTPPALDERRFFGLPGPPPAVEEAPHLPATASAASLLSAFTLWRRRSMSPMLPLPSSPDGRYLGPSNPTCQPSPYAIRQLQQRRVLFYGGQG